MQLKKYLLEPVEGPNHRLSALHACGARDWRDASAQRRARCSPKDRHTRARGSTWGPATPVFGPPGAPRRLRARAGQYPFRVRLTEFWARMRAQFGDVYAQSVAKDYVFARLGGRTVERALADGEDAKVVWRAVCETFDVPEKLR